MKQLELFPQPAIPLDPLPADPLGRQLCHFFPYRWHFIYGSVDRQGKTEWRTENRYPITPCALWQKYQDPATQIGVRFGSDTSYALLDIDRHSAYHPNQDPTAIPRILQQLETVGLVRSLRIRSSRSGGIHLYLPLPTAIKTYPLARTLRYCLESAHFAIIPGKLEIFPNTKGWKEGEATDYLAHRLPLQPGSGSCLLDDDFTPTSNHLQDFLTQWHTAAQGNDLQILQEATEAANSQPYRRQSTRCKQWQADLETTIHQGWTGDGETNTLLGQIAIYGRVFLHLAGDDLREHIHTTASTLPGYEEHCDHLEDIARRAQDWAKSAEKYYWPYGTERKRPQKYTYQRFVLEGTNPDLAQLEPLNQNEQSAQNAQARIREAVTTLSSERKPITSQAILNLAHCSKRTLYKYRPLWDPTSAHEMDPYTPSDSAEIPISGAVPSFTYEGFQAQSQNCPITEAVEEGGLGETTTSSQAAGITKTGSESTEGSIIKTNSPKIPVGRPRRIRPELTRKLDQAGIQKNPQVLQLVGSCPEWVINSAIEAIIAIRPKNPSGYFVIACRKMIAHEWDFTHETKPLTLEATNPPLGATSIPLDPPYSLPDPFTILRAKWRTGIRQLREQVLKWLDDHPGAGITLDDLT